MRHAIRTLINSPGFTLVAVLTLALGVGANAAMFSAVNGVLLKPLPFSDPDALIHIWTENHAGVKSSQSPGSYLDIRQQSRSLVEMAGYRTDMIGLASNAEPLQVEGAYVTSEFFDVLGTPAAYGQPFSKARGQHPGERLVVLGDEAARRLFGTPAAAAGQAVRVNAESYVVAAVMPASFAWPRGAGVWVLSAKDVPPAPVEGADAPTNRDIRYFEAVARLKPHVTLAQAQQDLDRVAARMIAEHGNTEARSVGMTPVREEIVGDVSGALWLLQAAVCLVLLIACANISSLLIARATGRRRELAIRAALGAGRGRLVRQLLTESLIIGVAGGLAGLLLGAWLIAVLVRVLPENVPRATNIGLDVTVTAVTIAAALLASMLFGILPALQGSRADAIAAMKEAGDRGGSARARGRAALVVGEIALTLVLLVGAGLLINSLMRLQRVDTGMRPEHVTVAFLNVPQSRYATAAAQTQLYGRLLEGLSGLPQIDAAGVGFPGPLHGSSASGSFDIEGYTPPTRADRPFAYIGMVSEDYLAALGVPLLSGRTFTASDSAEAPPVVMVSTALAHKYWPGENPVGKRIKFDDDPKSPWITVVGLVGDTRQLGLRQPAPPLLYFPYQQFPLPFTTVAVRSPLPDATVASMLRARLAELDRAIGFGDIRTLRRELDRSIEQPRFRTLVLGVFAALALILAAVGVFGVISYSVAQRTREIGIRVALGARPAQVLRPMLREGLWLALIGIGIGLAGALAASRVLAAFLFGVGATDPITFVAVAAVLLVIALLASYIPSRRALKVDPLIALRAE